MEECGLCPVFASFTLAFALQLEKKHGKTSVRVRKTSVRLRKTSVKVQYAYYQKYLHVTKHQTPTHYKTVSAVCLGSSPRGTKAQQWNTQCAVVKMEISAKIKIWILYNPLPKVSYKLNGTESFWSN
jgi:hypothetical protein